MQRKFPELVAFCNFVEKSITATSIISAFKRNPLQPPGISA